MSYLVEYHSKIKSGEIVAGRDLIMQLDALIADLDNPAYIYDTKDAEFRIEFIERFCRHTKSPFYGMPFILELWQKAFIEAFYSFKWTNEGYEAYYGEKPNKPYLRRFKKAILLVSRKNGKALALDTPIPTPHGWKTMGQIQVGDTVYDACGRPVLVVATSDVFVGHNCYEITFEDGEKIISDADHIWYVTTERERSGHHDYFDITTKSIAEDFICRRYYVPVIWTAKTQNKSPNKSIINIAEVPSVPTKCISVDSPKHLYLAGKRMTVTHNSTLSSALAFTEFMCGAGGTDIVCSSNDDAQASIVFEEVNNVREMFDPKGKRTHKNLKGIYNLKNKSRIFKLSDRTRNKEGRNIDGAILDESNEMETNVIAKSIDQSQSTKDEPWFVNITTEGFVNDGYLDNELKYARAVLAGELEDATLLSWLYTQDSENEIWQDERSWQKSNPSLGNIKKVKYLKDQIRKAQLDKGERIFMLAKDFNWKTNNAAAWLTQNEYESDVVFNVEEFRDHVALGAVDLSETTDLCCAKAMLMRKNDLKKYFLTKYFIPESKVEQGSKEDRKNYLDWAKQGLVEICPGNENDYSMITAWYVKLYKELGIRVFKIGLDKWNAKYLMKELDGYGFDTETVGMDWGLSNPMKLLEADLKSSLVVYDGNPIDKWCLGNTGIKVDNLGRVMPVKTQGLQNLRIDGAVTKIIAYAMYIKHRTEFTNLLR
ncbi:terminase TerL endonuclease subunit [Paenibacillus oleatilyticus]|uniref:terminase TerL endonuclease subunit n=1 Tax=Paenibacillus oleatilyticus TaxID=2594886 RepID=UPI001C200A4D|nr:terminase TerL endonuclease subunit [Paenibacillus oleatilyticus]MBU7320285.1 hypothetical protein [Paenibacillus oleatilyticus]